MRHLSAAVAALALLLGCRATSHHAPPEGDPPLSEVRRVWFPGRERLRKEYAVLVYPDGRAVKHGKETEWFEDGTVSAEREFRDGEPAGTWRTFHPGGAPESVVEIGDGETLAPMRWWYPDGSPHAAGSGLGGVREGSWTYWHPNGALAEEGPFLHSRRHGWWTIYDAQGRKRADGAYELGRRVGRWNLWDEQGRLFENEGDPPAALDGGDRPGSAPQ